MTFSYRSYELASIEAKYLEPQPMLGGYCLTLGLAFDKKVGADTPVVVSDFRVRLDAEPMSRPGETLLVGFSSGAPHWRFTVEQYSQTEYGQFEFCVSQAQLASLEELRGNGGLRFRIKLTALAHGVAGAHPATKDIVWEANLSKWIEFLRTAKAVDYLVVPVPFAQADPTSPLHPIGQRLRSAQNFFLQGEYHAVVSECRLAIDAIGGLLDPTGEDIFAVASANRRSMPKAQRLALIQAAVRHFTHLAHHNPGEGDALFSRSDAVLVLGATGALLNREVARRAILDGAEDSP